MGSPDRNKATNTLEEYGISEHDLIQTIERDFRPVKDFVSNCDAEENDYFQYLATPSQQARQLVKRIDHAARIAEMRAADKRKYTNVSYNNKQQPVVPVLQGTPYMLLLDQEFTERKDLVDAICAVNFHVSTNNCSTYKHIMVVESANRDKCK
jgi:hypothetical protein